MTAKRKRKEVHVEHVALARIVPNRYRNIKSYKISDTKVEALIQSYENSGFWDGSIQGRPHPTKKGKIEIAFGHHRIEAARRAKLGEIGIVVSRLSDADMLHMMADENREEFKHDALVSVETIGQVIEAYGRGEIELPPVAKDGPRGETLPSGKVYSLATVARFLGWVKPSNNQATSACIAAFRTYHNKAAVKIAKMLPEGLRDEAFVSTVTVAANTARKAAKKAGKSESQQEQVAVKAAKAQVKEIVREKQSKRARVKARAVGLEAAGEKPPLPNLKKILAKLVRSIKARITRDQEMAEGITAVSLHADELPGYELQQYASALHEEATRMERSAEQFRRDADKLLSRAHIHDITPKAKRGFKALLLKGGVSA